MKQIVVIIFLVTISLQNTKCQDLSDKSETTLCNFCTEINSFIFQIMDSDLGIFLTIFLIYKFKKLNHILGTMYAKILNLSNFAHIR